VLITNGAIVPWPMALWLLLSGGRGLGRLALSLSLRVVVPGSCEGSLRPCYLNPRQFRRQRVSYDSSAGRWSGALAIAAALALLLWYSYLSRVWSVG
jgi:hypothetical protein